MGDEWIINGSEMFISGADRAKGMLIVTELRLGGKTKGGKE
ncbi:MAG: hypothetical protein QW356_02590 [Candidatus Hadarchaeales archaeon]